MTTSNKHAGKQQSAVDAPGQREEATVDTANEHLTTRVCNGALFVTLARPARKNAFTDSMYRAFADALHRLADEAELHCLVIQAEGNVFCAGNDLNDFLDQGDLNEHSPVIRVLHALAKAEKPLVAAVAGPAVGIGTTLLLHCDLVFATAAARFSAPFVPLGLVPEAASSQLLPALVGHRVAMEMFLLGRSLQADEALAAGLVNQIVEPDELAARVAGVAEHLGSLPQEAVRATKKLCRAAPASLADVIEAELVEFAPRLRSPETRAAIETVLSRKR